MKILAVMGTTRVGNTVKVVEKIEENIKETADIDFEYLYLNKVDLKQCIGCHNCIFKGEEYCPHKDDREEIEKKILEADGVIFASPGYVFNVTALMKNFIDRFAYRCHRPVFLDKKALLVATSSPWCSKETNKAMKIFVEASGFHIIDELGVAIFPMPMVESEQIKNENAISKSAMAFYNGIKNKEERPPLKMQHLMQFRAMRSIAKKYPQKFSADYRYFNEIGAYEKGSKWYVAAKINPIKNLLANFAEGKMNKQFAKIFLDGDE